MVRIMPEAERGANGRQSVRHGSWKLWRQPYVLDIVRHQPLQERFVVFGQLNLGLLLGIGWRHDIDAQVIEPASGVIEIDPVLILPQFGRRAAVASGGHEEWNLHAEPI